MVMAESALIDQVLAVPEIQDGIFSPDQDYDPNYRSYHTINNNNSNNMLSPHDLAQCVRVSKAWQKIATPFLWRVINGGIEQQMEQVIRRQHQPQSCQTSKAKWIRHLIFNSWKVIESLVETQECSNLQRLVFEIPFIDSSSQPSPRLFVALETLIHQNQSLQEYSCFNYQYYHPLDVFNQSIATGLMESCSNHLSSLRLRAVFLHDYDLGNVLNHCQQLKVLSIESCGYMVKFLETFKDCLPNLEELSFIGNSMIGNKIPGMGDDWTRQGTRGQDWIRLLKSTDTSLGFESLQVGSEGLTTKEFLDLMTCLSLTKIHSFYISKNFLNSEKESTQLLNILPPLTRICLIGVPFGQEALKILESKHQDTLESLGISTLYEQELNLDSCRGLLTKKRFRLPRVKTLMIDYPLVSCEMMAPQLYPTARLKGLKNLDDDDDDDDDDNDDDDFDWTCSEVEHLDISFHYNEQLELDALGLFTWNRHDDDAVIGDETIKSSEELYVKTFLSIFEQVLKLPKLKTLDLSITTFQFSHQDSVHWKDLDGSWTRFEEKNLDRLSISWAVPTWIQHNFDTWRKSMGLL